RRMIDDDVSNRLRRTDRRGLARRYLNEEVKELTSRISSANIPATLDQLGVRFTGAKPEKNRYPVDVVLATNMISVGVDVPRLGLMICSGQPKTTAEYIQATSRVGRDDERPGLVVTLCNIYRPRDRSHFERFAAWHESFYRAVEATSVTPFSSRAVERGLAGVTVALARHGLAAMTPPRGAERVNAERAQLGFVSELISRRAETHDRQL
ncbi:MAG: helicase, partial [Gammaproteobacteria bacterium]|nr:helicase [Gammaproteobacteria bacterium]